MEPSALVQILVFSVEEDVMERHEFVIEELGVSQPIKIVITLSPRRDPTPEQQIVPRPERPFAPSVTPDGRCIHHGFAHSPWYDCHAAASRNYGAYDPS